MGIVVVGPYNGVDGRLEVDYERVTKLQNFRAQSVHTLFNIMFLDESCTSLHEELSLHSLVRL